MTDYHVFIKASSLNFTCLSVAISLPSRQALRLSGCPLLHLPTSHSGHYLSFRHDTSLTAYTLTLHCLMKQFTNLLALPTSLITLLSLPNPAQAESWPHKLAPHERFYPEHEPHLKRNYEIQQRLGSGKPAGMRKMSEDEGEKFFMEYWQFDQPLTVADERASKSVAHNTVTSNVSSPCDPLPPLLLHTGKQPPPDLHRLFGRSLFGRDFQCPSGTSSCTSINQPDACCATGETCISVQDTGNGPVGCCPAGETCGGEVTGCNTAAGYTSCPGSSNGGCCIPGYACQGIGCVYTDSTTTTTTLPLATITTGVSSEVPYSSSTTTTTATSISISAASVPTVQTVTTTIVSTPPASTGLTTVTQTIVISPSSTTPLSTTTTTTTSSATSTTPTAFVCTSGYHSCPASLGGGCCPTDRSCAPDRLCLATSTSTSTTTTTPTSSASAVPPVRPTSGSSDSSITTTTVSRTTSPITYSGCPTGFYMCSAYYLGGCCRVGRDCDTTSCPASASTSVLVTSGLTIVAGGSDASSVVLVTVTSTITPGASATGTDADTSGGAVGAATGCASGWFGCASSAGGGCCPSGFVCGASCTATVSGQSNIGKESPSSENKGRVVAWGVLGVGVVAGMGMVVL